MAYGRLGFNFPRKPSQILDPNISINAIAH